MVGSALTNGVPESEPRRFRVLATTPFFEPGFRGGGPVKSVAGILDTCSDMTKISLITRDRDLGSSQSYPGLSGRWIRRGQSEIFYLNVRSASQWIRLARALRAAPFDLLYVNSLWEPIFTIIPILAVRLGLLHVRRVMIAPRGELSPGALQLKARKKSSFLKPWGPLLRSMGVEWHASAEREASEIKAAIPWARVAINEDHSPLPPELVVAAAPRDGPPRFVFIGRISAKKNLALTLDALVGLSAPAVFDIYGPIEDGRYWSECESLIGQMPDHVRVSYRGELVPAEVRNTFSQYDAFLFPTLGENFGHVIAESLSACCPVLCSDETPWTRYLERGGGYVVRELTTEGLRRELERLAAMNPDARGLARRAAGRAFLSWRKGVVGTNILEEARIGQWLTTA